MHKHKIALEKRWVWPELLVGGEGWAGKARGLAHALKATLQCADQVGDCGSGSLHHLPKISAFH